MQANYKVSPIMSKSNNSNNDEPADRSRDESQAEITEQGDTRPGQPDTRPGRPDNRQARPDTRPGRPDNR